MVETSHEISIQLHRQSLNANPTMQMCVDRSASFFRGGGALKSFGAPKGLCTPYRNWNPKPLPWSIPAVASPGGPSPTCQPEQRCAARGSQSNYWERRRQRLQVEQRRPPYRRRPAGRCATPKVHVYTCLEVQSVLLTCQPFRKIASQPFRKPNLDCRINILTKYITCTSKVHVEWTCLEVRSVLLTCQPFINTASGGLR